MKKLIISTLLLLLCITTGYAQQKVYIHLSHPKDTTVSFYVWEIEDITFKNDDSVLSASEPDAIDLGLSVKWASFNLGANSNSEVGYLVGWGDNTGKNRSSNLKYFPVLNPTGNIINTNYDLANQLLGKEWRLPSQSEIQELIDNCNWTWETVNDVSGYRVSAKDGSGSIFIPITGKRKEEIVSDNSQGYYWSGMLDVEHLTNAIALELPSNLPNSVQTISLERFIGCAIRPVYGEYKVPVSVCLSEISDIHYYDVTVSGSLQGDYNKFNITSYGICYAKTEDALDINATEGNGIVKTDVMPSSADFKYTLNNLERNTVYYCKAFALIDGNYVFSDILSFKTGTPYPVADYVDLGLSVKWASWNVGAKSIDDAGGYYGWGDATGDLNSRYNTDYAVGNSSTNISNTKYDIAQVQWGSKWRLPSRSEYQELLDCKWVYKSNYNNSGVNGYFIYGKEGSGMEDNFIFMPLAGYKPVDGSPVYYGEDGHYWTSECQDDQVKAYYVSLYNRYIPETASEKSIHLPIRPVYDEATSGGTTPGGDTPTPGGDDPTPGGDDPQPQTMKVGTPVDLGLSTGILWSDINMGAQTSEDYGYYYAWGETEKKDSYNFDNYLYKVDGATDMNVQESYLEIGTNIKGTAYDVAHEKWGGKWRMPTENEMWELINECTWTWKDNGFLITGPNKKTIFLPATGYFNGSSVYGDYTQARYWTSNVNVYKDSYHAWARALSFVKSSGEHFMGSYVRSLGCTIRPVYDKTMQQKQ